MIHPPAPWLRDLDISKLKQDRDRDKLRFAAHQTQSNDDWDKYRNIRNQLKKEIKRARNSFYRKSLSSKRDKQVWKFIHRVLNPSPRRINVDPEALNNHYVTTANRLLNKKSEPQENLYKHIDDLPPIVNKNSFSLHLVSYDDVITELKSLREDCSTGYDQIPTNLLKLVLDTIASPLTNIINTSIIENIFPHQWKINKVSPIPKINCPTDHDDYRPISILPVLSKVFERLMAKQICNFITTQCIYKDTMAGFRKSHSTTTLLLKIRDDILKAMSRGEVTLAVFADYSKSFDTVEYKTIITKLHLLGFSKASLCLITSYLTKRFQYVQVNGKSSSRKLVNFGVPQGSVLGPILFNLYVTDLQDGIETKICQYADDTTCYAHSKVKNLHNCIKNLESDLSKVCTYSTDNNLIFNAKKTKVMLFGSSKMFQLHNLGEKNTFSIMVNNKKLERESVWKVLGINFDEHLKWSSHINDQVKSCYKKLSVLRHLKRFTNLNRRKMLAESLVLAKLDYGNALLYNANQTDINRIQKAINTTAAYVTGKYCRTSDVLQLNWLPANERMKSSLIKLTHKSIHDDQFPAYLKLNRKIRNSNLRQLTYDLDKVEFTVNDNTFQGKPSRLFNDLPSKLRSEKNYNSFSKHLKSYLIDSALARTIT